MQSYTFLKAQPVWAKDREREKNLTLVFRAELPAAAAVLRITGHSDYQIFINGDFFAQGPARAGHGFFRVDELDLQPKLNRPRNLLCILAAGYNVNSFALTDQPAFLCAEVVEDGSVLAATGTEQPFLCTVYNEKVQKTPRISFQRPFTESYRFSADYDRLFKDPDYAPPAAETSVTAPKRFITRETLRSDYEERDAVSVVSLGSVQLRPGAESDYADRSLVDISDLLKGYAQQELELDLVNALLRYDAAAQPTAQTANAPLTLNADTFAVYDMGLDTTGYVRIALYAKTDTVIYAIFNEKLPEDGAADPRQNGVSSVVRWALEGGRAYDLLSFEPYTYRYLEVLSLFGEATVQKVSQVSEHYPAAGLRLLAPMKDPQMQKVYDAAVETFRQNATDIFMDCPSRERAGWLCDSFFTARSERAITGESRIERAFLENFIMEESFTALPEGMLPMCYPSDHYDGVYIPNWAMWYLVELAEYRRRSGDTDLIARAKEKMYALAAFLGRYENEDGLLEKLDSWVFVEWSRANDFTQDVNYPTNMLYAKFLESLGGLYGDSAALEKAAKLKAAIRAQSFDGTFFRDHAVRENGVLQIKDDHTETAQYYAFFTGVATPATDPELFALLKTAFGPGRDPDKTYPDVPVSNAFIGNFLRLDVLFEAGAYEQVRREIKSFFLPMAEATGTLWENMTNGASCCHGFASHVAYWLHKLAELE